MASVSRLSRRKDASRWPRMSSTFWAVVLLTALLVLYCGKWMCRALAFWPPARPHARIGFIYFFLLRGG